MHELLDYWRLHHRGWLRPDVVLYRRVEGFQAGQPGDEGWPSFDNAEYLKQREQERRVQGRADELRRIEEQRRENAARREQAAAEREGISLVAIAAEIAPELARGIERERKRMYAREVPSTLPGTELTGSVSAAKGPF